ncbi:hypothetical protein [Microcoleus sp. herbarium12]
MEVHPVRNLTLRYTLSDSAKQYHETLDKMLADEVNLDDRLCGGGSI